MVSGKDAQRVEAWINEAVAGGGRIVTGGKREEMTETKTVVFHGAE